MKTENSPRGELDWKSIKDTTKRSLFFAVTCFLSYYTANTELVNEFIQNKFGYSILTSVIIFFLVELRKKYYTNYSK